MTLPMECNTVSHKCRTANHEYNKPEAKDSKAHTNGKLEMIHMPKHDHHRTTGDNCYNSVDSCLRGPALEDYTAGKLTTTRSLSDKDCSPPDGGTCRNCTPCRAYLDQVNPHGEKDLQQYKWGGRMQKLFSCEPGGNDRHCSLYRHIRLLPSH